MHGAQSGKALCTNMQGTELPEADAAHHVLCAAQRSMLLSHDQMQGNGPVKLTCESKWNGCARHALSVEQ